MQFELLTDATVDGSGDPVALPVSYLMDTATYGVRASGVWDGATMTLECSLDDGATWFLVGENSGTAAEWTDDIDTRATLYNALYRGTITLAGGSTSLSLTLVGP